MKFKQRSDVIVDAELYTAGTEDGYNFYNATNKWLGYFEKGAAYPRAKRVPVIHSTAGNLEITEGDWIVTDSKGMKHLMTEEVFRGMYEPVEGVGKEQGDLQQAMKIKK